MLRYDAIAFMHEVLSAPVPAQRAVSLADILPEREIDLPLEVIYLYHDAKILKIFLSACCVSMAAMIHALSRPVSR